jgi:hypothetical protein
MPPQTPIMLLVGHHATPTAIHLSLAQHASTGGLLNVLVTPMAAIAKITQVGTHPRHRN